MAFVPPASQQLGSAAVMATLALLRRMATTRLHVAGIAPNTTADDLRQLLPAWRASPRWTIRRREPAAPRGYAFVEVKNAADADACVAAYDNATWQGDASSPSRGRGRLQA